MEAWREELYHSGVPGMKWGVRRYQNKDGSLTSAGRLHYRKQLGLEGSNTRASGVLTPKERNAKGKEFAKLARKDAQREQIDSLKKTSKEQIDSLKKTSKERIDSLKKTPEEHTDLFKQNEFKREHLSRLSGNIGNFGKSLESVSKQYSRSKTKAVDLSKMSDAELQRVINRFNLERNYKEIIASQDASTRASATDFINTVATVTGITASIAGIASSVHALRSKG